MNLTLSWDLFILAFFTIVVAYSFIIGKNQTLKVIISTYIAVLTADAVGEFIEKIIIANSPFLKMLPQLTSDQTLIFMKIIILILVVVILVAKGGFYVDIPPEKSFTLRFVELLILGILSAGLIVSTILIYVSGISLFQATPEISTKVIKALINQSLLAKIIIVHYTVWFSAPAVFLALISIFRNNE